MLNRSALIALALSAAAAPAFADPITYAISGAFDGAGEGTFSGTLTYDADTNTYSAVNVVATAGVSAPARTYTAVQVPDAGVARLLESPVVVNTSGGLPLVFDAPLSNAGTTVNIVAGTEGVCLNPSCTSRGAPFRNVASGTAAGPAVVAVPTLSEWAMILFGGLLAGGVALYVQRRRNGAGSSARA